MRKAFTLLALSLAISLTHQAQSSLVFSRAIIVSNTQQTVPADKVWKVTAIYGADMICLLDATLYTTATSPTYQTYYVGYTGTGMLVNGVNVPSQRTWNSPPTAPTTIFTYPDNTCKNNNNNVTRQGIAFDVAPNPNVLPQWLPEGTTLQSISNKVFISVLEFDIQ